MLEYLGFVELSQNVVKLEERCKKLSGDNTELEAADNQLRTALSQMEQMKKDLQHKATILLWSTLYMRVFHGFVAVLVFMLHRIQEMWTVRLMFP